MKRLFVIGVLLMATAVNAQDSIARPDSLKVWKTKGNFSLLLNQSSFSNWVAGGEDNLSGTAGVNYDFNYEKRIWSWDNKVIGSYGLVKTHTSPFEKKTDDRFEFSSLLGRHLSKYWYLSSFLSFKTQFTKGYIYSRDAAGAEHRAENTGIFSPGYLTFGPGVMWKKDENLKFNLAPVSSKITFVDDKYTRTPGYVDGEYFGVSPGNHLRYELGFYASGYYKFVPISNVTFENIISLYSNYIEDPQNVDIDYQLNIAMKINKWLSTNISFQAIYDDNAYYGFQTREVFGLAVNYVF